jgi:peptidoglycan/LPS O-acetylase OafA/YrhL
MDALASESQSSPLHDKTAATASAMVDSPKSAESGQRNQAVDVIRLIAAASIVFVHSVRTPEIARWGNLLRFAVPFFLFASLYFQSLSLRRSSGRTLSQYVLSRVRRLYLPFLAWSLIYLIARNVKRLTLLKLGLVKLELGLLWKGTEYHLYFLPLLLACSIVLACVHWWVLRRDPRWRWPLSVLAVALGLAFALLPMPAGWDETFDNPTYAYVWTWRAAPAAFWALAFAWLMTAGPTVYRVSSTVGFLGLALTVVCSIKQAVHGIQLIPRALTGLGSVLVALAPWRLWQFDASNPALSVVGPMARLGRYGYGIYLCHVLIIETVRAVAARLHLNPSWGLDLMLFGLSFAGSTILVLLFARTRFLAWLNG